LLTGVLTGVLLPLVYFAIPVIYGSGFERAADLLLPLALVSCMQSICQPITAFAYARHQGGRLLRSNAVALAINVLVALALIGPLGVWGAVIANAVGQIAAIMVLGRHELRLQALTLRAFVSAVRLWPVASLAGLLCIGVLSMAATAGTPDWVTLVAAPFVGAVLLIALARACKAGLLEADQAPLLEAMPRRLRSVFARLTMFFIIDETPGFATRVSSEKTADPRENQ
jgi:O-antigen/teichoic acid export membrane protein